jgi:hypothetical protein
LGLTLFLISINDLFSSSSLFKLMFAVDTAGLARNTNLKGQSNEIFLLPIFFTKRIVLVSVDMPKSDFEICQILVELFILKFSTNLLPAVNDSGESKIEP